MILVKIDTFTKSFEDLLKKGQNLRPLMIEISGHLLDAVMKNFDTEGGRLSKGWPALSKKTLSYLRRKGKTGKMLQRSAGGLKASISSKATQDTAEVGTNKLYAAIHQFGGVIDKASRSETFQRLKYKKGAKKGKFKPGTLPGKGFTFKSHKVVIPVRPYLAINKEDEAQIQKSIDKYLKP